MCFIWWFEFYNVFSDIVGELLGILFDSFDCWNKIINYLIVWDVLFYLGYFNEKWMIFICFVFGWDCIFVEGDIDWWFVLWGGVLIDDRLFGLEEICNNCIFVVDDLVVSIVEEVMWFKDSDIVFGVEVNGEICVYLCCIMEVCEMVNDILGGCQLGILYCIFCGVMQVYFMDNMFEGVECLVLWILGFLICLNKVMYDYNIYFVFDIFLGYVVIGFLVEIGLKLDQVMVIIIDWGIWKV